MTQIAASGGVSMPVSIIGRSKPSSIGRHLGADQRAAEQHAEDDRADRRALDPAVGDDELLRRQELGQDAVLGRRVGGGAEAHDRVGERAGARVNSISMQPTTLIALVISITRPLGIESANAPTSGASTT